MLTILWDVQFLQDGAYGGHRLFEPGFMKRIYPRPLGESAPKLINKEIEVGIGLGRLRLRTSTSSRRR